MINLILGLCLGLIASIAFFFLYKRFFERQTKDSFSNLSKKTLIEVMPSLLDIAKKELTNVREEIGKDVIKEKNLIKESLNDLEKNIKEKQEELKNLEKERNKQFGTISESLKNHKEIANELKEKTENLGKILSNNKLRGKWGERMAEDILQWAGFKKGAHYLKQSKNQSGTIPDFTLILPNNRKINIDAKFPFDNLRLYQETKDKSLKQKYFKKFKQDIKQKVREVTTRDYISEKENTLDYVILFVPSDIIYGFINEQLSDVVDDAFAKKVLITSPTSLYATLRIIMESYRHFMYEKNIRQVLKIIQNFIDNFRRFQDEFTDFDKAISKLRENYNQITGTRYNKMKVQIRKIEKLENLSTIEPNTLKLQDQPAAADD